MAAPRRGSPVKSRRRRRINSRDGDVPIEKEAPAQAFDQEFIALARSVYQRDDARFAVNRRIKELLSSELVEEKSHGAAGGPR
jgi:hypothetical protein